MYAHQGNVLEKDAARHLNKCFETLPNNSVFREHMYISTFDNKHAMKFTHSQQVT